MQHSGVLLLKLMVHCPFLPSPLSPYYRLLPCVSRGFEVGALCFLTRVTSHPSEILFQAYREGIPSPPDTTAVRLHITASPLSSVNFNAGLSLPAVAALAAMERWTFDWLVPHWKKHSA